MENKYYDQIICSYKTSLSCDCNEKCIELINITIVKQIFDNFSALHV